MGGGYRYGNSYPAQNSPVAPNAQYYQPVYPFMFGGGCLGRLGFGGYGYNTAPYAITGAQLNITTAVTIAQNYVSVDRQP